MTQEKTREIRIRRTLARWGYTLSKSRRRDTRAPDYGRFTISNRHGPIYEAPSLDEVDQWVAEYNQAAANAWEREGWVGIDTGRLMLTDPTYPADMPEDFLTSDCIADDVAGWNPHGGTPIALIVGNFGGDGLYPVSVRRDVDGRVNAVRIDFTYDQEI